MILEKAIKDKYKNIRTYYVKEVKKVEQSTRSGAGTSGVYVPTWPYFNSLEFMRCTVEIGETASSVLPDDNNTEQPRPDSQASQSEVAIAEVSWMLVT